jgi:septum formation protein
MNFNLKDKRIILASKSPRRHELLKGLDLDFEVQLKEIDESYPSSMAAIEVPSYLAKKKANAFRDQLKESTIIITADTIVICKDEILEKPKSKEEAISMIQKMSGETHTVVTGVSIQSIDKSHTFSDHTEVTFAQLSDEEINYYVDKYRPYDKAGAYGVQEWIGYVGIVRLEGSYFNVMGLPVHKVYEVLKHF